MQLLMLSSFTSPFCYIANAVSSVLSLKGSWPEGKIQRTALDTVNGFSKVFRGQAGLCFSMRELQLLFPWSLSGYVLTTPFYLSAISALKNWSSFHMCLPMQAVTDNFIFLLYSTQEQFTRSPRSFKQFWCLMSDVIDLLISDTRLVNNYFQTQ